MFLWIEEWLIPTSVASMCSALHLSTKHCTIMTKTEQAADTGGEKRGKGRGWGRGRTRGEGKIPGNE